MGIRDSFSKLKKGIKRRVSRSRSKGRPDAAGTGVDNDDGAGREKIDPAPGGSFPTRSDLEVSVGKRRGREGRDGDKEKIEICFPSPSTSSVPPSSGLGSA